VFYHRDWEDLFTGIIRILQTTSN